MIRFSLISFISILIFGCSSTAKVPNNLQPTFTTRITDSGLKHFQIQLVRKNASTNHSDARPNRPQRPNQSGAQVNNTPPSVKRDRQAKRNETILLTQAEIQTLETGFCREGFWLLDKNLYDTAPHLRGECNDLATEADREKYPDTLTNW